MNRYKLFDYQSVIICAKKRFLCVTCFLLIHWHGICHHVGTNTFKKYILLFVLDLQSLCWVLCWGECQGWSQQRFISWSTVQSHLPLICAVLWGKRLVFLVTTCWLEWTLLAWPLLAELESKQHLFKKYRKENVCVFLILYSQLDLNRLQRHFYIWLIYAVRFYLWSIRSQLGVLFRYLAEWMSYGYPTANVWPLDIKRFGNLQSSRTFLRHRVMEVMRELTLLYCVIFFA